MKIRIISPVLLLVLFGTMGFSSLPFLGVDQAQACACAYSSGDPGGGDYVPQQQGQQGGSYFDRPALTQDQARDLLRDYLARSNASLEIGAIRDAGDFFEADVLSETKEIVEKLAIDKQTGRIRTIY